jgi:DNA replication protein DnaC
MLIHPTVERLRSLGLSAMADAVIELQTNAEAADLPHADWLGLLIDREVTCRDTRRLARRLQVAKLRQAASVENVDYRTPRGLDRALFQSLATSQWLREHHHVAITGPTGTGKSWLACALWGTAPVATASRSSTNAPRACLPIWLKPAARDGSRA